LEASPNSSLEKWADDVSRTVLITGASRGLGLRLAAEMAVRGDVVFGCGRSKAPADISFRYIEADVRDEKSVKALFSTLRKEADGLDVLINNAGLADAKSLLLSRAEDFAGIFAANVTGAAIMSREAAKMMKRRGGAIINISSIHVPLASVGSGAYGASKAALEQLSRVMAHELASDSISVNSLGLSYVEGAGMAEAQSKKAVEAASSRLARPGLIAVDEVLHAVDFLSSPAARNITGETLYFGGPL
jgi:3-oxoacyl-[acyl-carrier protein] reductase|tara:strand:- start:5068 stop:5808 length:741 start_codon:yes stop_codon:yes gene_type:complete